MITFKFEIGPLGEIMITFKTEIGPQCEIMITFKIEIGPLCQIMITFKTDIGPLWMDLNVFIISGLFLVSSSMSQSRSRPDLCAEIQECSFSLKNTPPEHRYI